MTAAKEIRVVGLKRFAMVDLIGTTTIVAVLFAIAIPIAQFCRVTTSIIIPLIALQVLALIGGMFKEYTSRKAILQPAGSNIGIVFSSKASWSLLWGWFTVLVLLLPSATFLLNSNYPLIIATQPVCFSFMAGMRYARCLWRNLPGVVQFFENGLIFENGVPHGSEFHPWSEVKLVGPATSGASGTKMSFRCKGSNSVVMLELPNVLLSRLVTLVEFEDQVAQTI